MIKDDSVYLENMLMYLIKLEKFVEDKEIKEFLKNEMMQNHVIRFLEIIGEASIKLSKELKEKYPDVAWAKIRGMRNILVHDYGNIKLEVIWDTAKTSITSLKEQIKKIIKDVNPQILINYE